jgi:DNA primase
VLEQAVRGRNLHRPADKAAAAEEVFPYVRAVRNGIQKREYFDMVMDALRIEERALRHDLWQTVKAGSGVEHASVQQKIARAEGGQPTIAEQRLLELLFTDEDLRHAILPRIEATDYENLPTAGIFRALMEIEEQGAEVDFSTLSERTVDDPLASDLLPLLLMNDGERAEGEALDDVMVVAESCLNALRMMSTDHRISELALEISAAERAGDLARRDQLALEHLEWTRHRNRLSSRTDA